MNNKQWVDLMSKIGRAGPQNAAVLDTERSIIEKGDAQILVVDEELSEKLKFAKEGQFREKEGAATLKLVGDVLPIDRVEVVKKIKENLIKAYPLSAMDVLSKVKSILPDAKQHDVWNAIKENGLKENADYSVYNFRNKGQEDLYLEKGELSSGTPSIYNDNAVKYIVETLKRKD